MYHSLNSRCKRQINIVDTSSRIFFVPKYDREISPVYIDELKFQVVIYFFEAEVGYKFRK
jgi:hypothetical protein